MSGAEALDVPVIDLAAFKQEGQREAVKSKFRWACEEVGFLQVINHSAPSDVIKKMVSICEDFFHSPEEEKKEVAMLYPGYPYGYSAFQTESLSQSLGVKGPKDLKEAFAIGNPNIKQRIQENGETKDVEGSNYDQKHFANLWPAGRPEFREVFESYYSFMEQLASDIMEVAAVTLELEIDYFKPKMDNHLTSLRVIFYPQLSREFLDDEAKHLEGELIRAGAHSDWGAITILYVKDNAPGLEYFDRKSQVWKPVQIHPHQNGTFVVNIGDLLSRWTNDRWLSTLHRVVIYPNKSQQRSESGTERVKKERDTEGGEGGMEEGEGDTEEGGEGHRRGGDGDESRLSIAFFSHPNAEARIECIPTCLKEEGEKPKYSPISSGEYLKEKFESIQPK